MLHFRHSKIHPNLRATAQLAYILTDADCDYGRLFNVFIRFPNVSMTCPILVYWIVAIPIQMAFVFKGYDTFENSIRDFKSPWSLTWFLISKVWFLISKLISDFQVDFWYPTLIIFVPWKPYKTFWKTNETLKVLGVQPMKHKSWKIHVSITNEIHLKIQWNLFSWAMKTLW